MPLANSLFFVHIPKTAGTSLRLALEDALGKEHISYDYGPDSPVTDPDIKRLGYPEADMFRLERVLARKHCKLVAGHVHAARYMPMMQVLRTFTFIRNPVDQLISHYEHHVRNYGYDEPLAAFIKKPGVRQIATRMLKGVPLEAIGFVGVTEQYETSLALLSDRFNLEIPVRYDNRNPAAEKAYTVPRELEAEAREFLQADEALWLRAQTLLQSRQKAAREGYSYVHGAIQSMTAQSVSGFAFLTETNNPARVAVSVNSKQVGRVTSATVYRPALQLLHAPRNACVGFDIRLPRILKPGDIVTCFVPSTGQILDERKVTTSNRAT